MFARHWGISPYAVPGQKGWSLWLSRFIVFSILFQVRNGKARILTITRIAFLELWLGMSTWSLKRVKQGTDYS